ncbi:LysR family transcriptional regulator [Clostridium sp. JNZ X4-2]
MELQQLKYFETIAKYENMTKASKLLLVSQPALSRTLRQLENELGVKLFDRNGRTIQLNRYGKVFFKKVHSALSSIEDGKRELVDMKENKPQNIKLMVLSASGLIPDLLSSFREIYPKVGFSLFQNENEYGSDDCDFSILSSYSDILNKFSIPLRTEEIYLGVPNNHPLSCKKSINLIEAKDESFISLKPNKALRKITDIFCEHSGFIPNIVFESDEPSMVRGLIKAGLGVAFVPYISWTKLIGPSISLIHIDMPKCERTIYLSWKEGKYLTKSDYLFKSFTEKYFKEL